MIASLQPACSVSISIFDQIYPLYACLPKRPVDPPARRLLVEYPLGVRCLSRPVPFSHRDARPGTEIRLCWKASGALQRRHKSRRRSGGEQLWTSSLCLQGVCNEHCTLQAITVPYVATAKLAWLIFGDAIAASFNLHKNKGWYLYSNSFVWLS